jgi:hypothetical protein
MYHFSFKFTFTEKFVQAVVVSFISSEAWVVVFESAMSFASSAGVLLLVVGSGFAVVVAAAVVEALVVVVVLVVGAAEVSSEGDRDVVCGADVVLWGTSVDVVGTAGVKTSPWIMLSCASSFSKASLIELAMSLLIVYANEEMIF